MIERVYCATCEEVSLDSGRPRCAWCDGLLAPVEVKERKRRRHSKWTDLKVNQCYEAYLKGHSCNQIADVIWESMGFASAKACSQSLWREFKEVGFALRSQSAVTVARNFKHGKATRASRLTGGTENAEYRRWFKEVNGRYNPKCPECGRPAMDDDEFCFAHSPARAEERDRLCAEMREQGANPYRPGEEHTNATLTEAQVREIRRRKGEKQADLAAEFNVCTSSISNIQRGKSWTHLEAAA